MTGDRVSAPRVLAAEAAQAVRDLNHATIIASGYQDPGDVDQTLAELGLLAHRLPQTFTQAGRWLTDAQAAGRVGHDGHTDPDIDDDGPADAERAVWRVVALLALAGDLAGQLGRLVDGARQQTSHLYQIGGTS